MPFALPVDFATDCLLFVPLTPDDAPLIFTAYGQDEAVARFMTWRPHESVADTEAYGTAALAGTSRTYLLRDRGDGRLHGSFELRASAPHRPGCSRSSPELTHPPSRRASDGASGWCG